MNRIHKRIMAALFSAVLALSLNSWAQQPVLDQLIDPVSLSSDGTTLTIVFDDLKQDATAHFEGQHSDNVTRWTGISGATVTAHPTTAHRYTLIASDPGSERKFYRILGYSTSNDDSDGDGLSDTLEGTLGTDPNDADSDDDGYNDGTEFVYGTDPDDPNSFLDKAHLPAVAFTEALSSVQEGEGSHQIELSISPPFHGTIHYTLNVRSSAEEGTDFMPMPRTTTATGSSAVITVTPIDNLTIKQSEMKLDLDDPGGLVTRMVPHARLLIIDLVVSPPGNAYRAAGAVTHVVRISDDDAYWDGILNDGLTERNFRMCIAQDAATTTMNFVSGSADGLLNPEGGGTTSQSTGVIPDEDLNGASKETWPADLGAPTLTSTSFFAGVDNLPASLEGFGDLLKRRLQLFSEPSAFDNEYIDPNRIVGTYFERLVHATDENITYVNRNVQGIFYLTRDLGQAPPVNSPFDPTDD